MANLFDEMSHRLVRLRGREQFRPEGAWGNDVIFVRSGILANYRSAGADRWQIAALTFPNEVIVPGAGRPLYGVEAVVLTELIVAKLEHFETIMGRNPDMRSLLVRILQRNVEIGNEWLVNCGRRRAAERVAHFLCETAVRMGTGKKRLVIPFTHQQIGDITGQTQINVIRVFAESERNGLIKRNRRELKFRDWAELCRFGGFDPAYLAI